MAKNKPAFQSNNSKFGNGQLNKGDKKSTAAPAPKKPVRGNSRGQ